MLVALDSNILLRLANRDDPQHQVTRLALRFLSQQKAAFCFFPQIASEFWAVATRPASARGGYGLALESAHRFLEFFHRQVEFYPEIPAAYDIWRHLIVAHDVTGAQTHDAALAALMKAHGIGHLLTFNLGDFRRFPFITCFSPLELVATGLPQ